jgi:hypothetical protein
MTKTAICGLLMMNFIIVHFILRRRLAMADDLFVKVWQHHPLQVPTKSPQLALPFMYSKIISHAEEIENCTAGNKKKNTGVCDRSLHTHE